MNRIQSGLLLLLGALLLGTAAFWIFDRSPAPALTTAPAASVADSPVQVTEVTRRRPNMLLIGGRAPAGAVLTLRLAGNKVGEAVADSSGRFQLTTSPLPQGENLNFSLQLAGNDTSVFLTMIDRRPQPIALVTTKSRTYPLQRPESGSGVLLVQSMDPPSDHRFVGQHEAGGIVYAYANDILAGKAVADESNLFDLVLDDTKFQLDGNGLARLRFDFIEADGTLASRSRLDLNDGKAWQKFTFEDADNPSYIWRDFDAQETDTDQTTPGQFIPVADQQPEAKD